MNEESAEQVAAFVAN